MSAQLPVRNQHCSAGAGAHRSSPQEVVFVVGKKRQKLLQLLCAWLELGETEQPDLGVVGPLVTPLCLSVLRQDCLYFAF